MSQDPYFGPESGGMTLAEIKALASKVARRAIQTPRLVPEDYAPIEQPGG